MLGNPDTMMLCLFRGGLGTPPPPRVPMPFRTSPGAKVPLLCQGQWLKVQVGQKKEKYRDCVSYNQRLFISKFVFAYTSPPL